MELRCDEESVGSEGARSRKMQVDEPKLQSGEELDEGSIPWIECLINGYKNDKMDVPSTH
jgi:hypothetical protein